MTNGCREVRDQLLNLSYFTTSGAPTTSYNPRPPLLPLQQFVNDTTPNPFSGSNGQKERCSTELVKRQTARNCWTGSCRGLPPSRKISSMLQIRLNLSACPDSTSTAGANSANTPSYLRRTCTHRPLPAAATETARQRALHHSRPQCADTKAGRADRGLETACPGRQQKGNGQSL